MTDGPHSDLTSPDREREDWHDGPEPPRGRTTYMMLAALVAWLGALAWMLSRLFGWPAYMTISVLVAWLGVLAWMLGMLIWGANQ